MVAVWCRGQRLAGYLKDQEVDLVWWENYAFSVASEFAEADSGLSGVGEEGSEEGSV